MATVWLPNAGQGGRLLTSGGTLRDIGVAGLILPSTIALRPTLSTLDLYRGVPDSEAML
jgi:hypothetical protein